MQNKGFVRVFAILLTLVCVFYLSFSFVTRHYAHKAKEFAKGDVKVEQDYLDSLSNEKVWFGNWTLKQCREMEISLGLDLKGGMNVILEVSVPDVIKALADNKSDEAFNQALATAAKQATTSQDDVITLFIREYHRIAPDASLSQLFATQQLKDKVNQKSSDAEVEKVLREEVKAAVDNSFNVLRTRIDRFGVVQPNIQSLEDKMGRIMVELPGIKEPERVRKLLQGSANLEFWETYNAKDVASYLQSADAKLRAILATTEDAAEATDSVAAEAPAVAQATSTTDSLAAALKGESKTQAADLEQIKKEHPLLAVLQVNPSGQGPVVGYANYKDTADINKYLSMPEIQAEMPKDLRLKWGVSPFEYDPKAQTFELYAIKSTERNGRAPLEGDVVVNAKDEFDHYGKPAVSMSMNTDGARRWAQLTKQNIGRSIAIVLDTANKQRVDDERFAQALKVIKVDHHPDREPFGDICLINDSAAATCEILTFFFDTYKEYVFSQKTAEYLYRGLLTDSLNYTTNNTTQETLKAGGILASTGLDLSKISHDVFDNSIRGFKFTGYIISHTEVLDNAFAYVIIDEETYTSYGLNASDARSFVGKLSNVRDFSVYAVFTTKKDASGKTLYDGSLRSKKNRINDIAEKFGGGGHACAAGVKNLTQENMTNILNLLRKRI